MPAAPGPSLLSPGPGRGQSHNTITAAGPARAGPAARLKIILSSHIGRRPEAPRRNLDHCWPSGPGEFSGMASSSGAERLRVVDGALIEGSMSALAIDLKFCLRLSLSPSSGKWRPQPTEAPGPPHHWGEFDRWQERIVSTNRVDYSRYRRWHGPTVTINRYDCSIRVVQSPVVRRRGPVSTGGVRRKTAQSRLHRGRTATRSSANDPAGGRGSQTEPGGSIRVMVLPVDSDHGGQWTRIIIRLSDGLKGQAA